MPHSSPLPRPLFQGQLDRFCAVYAVLNACRLIFRLRVQDASAIFADTLASLAARPDVFRAVLGQTTDYAFLVDEVTARCQARYPLHMHRPFPGAKAGSVPPEALWKALEDWLASPGRTALVRFQRFLVPGGPALVRHWTAVRAVEGDSLELYDCSIQENAVHSIPEFGFATDPRRLGQDRLLLVEPEHVRLLERAFGER
ncbi:MAG: hypothetical protein K6E40_13010 [Desulfovibrio sp.]|nr:hypothetical protein [Desulfovibrio sp.]